MCAKTPCPKFLEKFAYKQSQHKGGYTSQMPVFRWVMLIILNDLSDEAHNAWIKCFASRPKEKKKAFVLLKSFFHLDWNGFYRVCGIYGLKKRGNRK